MIDSYIKGGAYDGGLVGYIESGTITNCYNAGSVTRSINSDYKNAGGIAGSSSGTVTGCYYDSQTSCPGGINGSDTAGVTVGKATVWMKNATGTDGKFSPNATITRAQAAKMLAVLLQR